MSCEFYFELKDLFVCDFAIEIKFAFHPKQLQSVSTTKKLEKFLKKTNFL